MRSALRFSAAAVMAFAVILSGSPSLAADDDPSNPNVHGRDTVSSPRVTLRWQASFEQGVYGYNLYRADRRQGPFRRVNLEVIHSAGVEDEAASYEFVDREVTAGKTYYYYLDTVSTTGRKQRFSGVIKKTVNDEVSPPSR